MTGVGGRCFLNDGFGVKIEALLKVEGFVRDKVMR